MKNSLITYLLGFFFLITCFKAIGRPGSTADTNLCLEIDGKILNTSEGKCIVELICGNNVVETAVLKDGKKKFKFVLKTNRIYSIRLSKEGFITRLISIDTKIVNHEDDIYKFSFETKLIERSGAEKLNKDFLDFPIALIYFDPKKECFDYNREYTSRIKKELAMN
jgi:hypothetical protein